MILILTFKEYEQSTDPVVDWLLYRNANFVKIFIEDLLTNTNGYRIEINNKKIFYRDIEITHKINVVFYRRFDKNIHFKSDLDLGNITRKIDKESNGELKDLFQYLFYILDNKIWFPHYSNLKVNKLEMLNLAQKAGLHIPSSIVTNSKKELATFKAENINIIYKPIRQISYYTFGNFTYSPYTTEIDDEKYEQLDNFFFPSLFQAKIKRDYEIRCFFLEGEIYASAIMTNSETSDVDIKLNFNSSTTKWVNYNLPSNIKEQIVQFMSQVKLTTGSIDLIKSNDNKFYFIEVNPVGQYFAPSINCNYYIEKKIADCLIKYDENENN